MARLFAELDDELRADMKKAVELMGGLRPTARKTGLDERYLTRTMNNSGGNRYVGELFLDTLFSTAGLPHYMVRYNFSARTVPPGKRTFTGGIYFDKKKNSWRVQPHFNGKRYYIGSTRTEEQAKIWAKEFYDRVKVEVETPHEIIVDIKRRAGILGNH